MNEQYKHTQIGYVVIIAVGGALFLLGSLLAVYGFYLTTVIVLILLVICLALFATLTVKMDEGTLEVRFGPGVIRKRFPLKDIESCQVVTNPWYYGWGIRMTPHGWLWNVSGLNAVEIQTKGGNKYRIGTDEPEELAGVIQRSLALAKERGDDG